MSWWDAVPEWRTWGEIDAALERDRRMIVRGGRDVTKEVHDRAEVLRRAHPYDFSGVLAYLGGARAKLDQMQRPWLDDRISDSIDAIDKLVVLLSSG